MRWRLRLLRLVETGLPPDERRRVEDALERSPRLRRERDDLARGLAAAETLSGAGSLGEERAAAIEAALRAAAARPRRERGRAVLALAASVLVALAAALAAAWDPGLRLVAGMEPPAPLEAAALGLYDRLAEDRLELDLETASPSRARRFVRRRAGLDARLVERSPGAEGRFELQGVALADVAGARAAGVAYRIGGRPALLLTARDGAVAGGPAHWTLLDRELRIRRAGTRRVLSWTNSGQSYVLVSELPGHGQESCSICHTGPERGQMVVRAAESL